MAYGFHFPVICMMVIGLLASNGAFSINIDSCRNAIKEITSYVGSHVTLNCSVPANQNNLTITWYKYGKPLQEVTYRHMGSILKERSRMLFLSNLLLADAGCYMCVVNGSVSTANWSYVLTVRESTSEPRLPSITEHSLRNKTVTYGQSVIFACEVWSMTVPYIEWYFKEITSATSNQNASYSRTRLKRLRGVPTLFEGSVSGRSYRVELRLFNVTYMESGWYVCRTFNRYGKASREAFLAVIPEPTLSRRELERNYAAMFGDNTQVPLALLISLPVAILIIACAVLIRSLEKSKQNHEQLAEDGKQRHKPDTDINNSTTIAMATTVHEERNNNGSIRNPMQDPLRAADFDDQRYTALSSSSQSLSTPEVWPATSSEQRDHAQYGQRHESLHSSSEGVITSSQPGLNLSSDALEMDWEGLDLKITESLELVQMPIEVEV